MIFAMAASPSEKSGVHAITLYEALQSLCAFPKNICEILVGAGMRLAA
jgi:hypothetical protein